MHELSAFLRHQGVSFRQIGRDVPPGARASDLDILTSADDFLLIPGLLMNFCRTNGSRLLSVDRSALGTFRFILGTCSDANGLECLHVSVSMRRGRRSIQDLIFESRCAWRRFRRRSGVFIAILGPDGSGKTSVIEGLTRALSGIMPDPLLIHFRPKFGAPQNLQLRIRNPHGRPPRGMARSLLKAAFYAADEIASYVGLIRPQLMRGRMVIFDRYFPDLLVDPLRYRFGGPAWAVILLERIVPNPDLMIVMDAPAAVIHARVQEVPFEETRRQLDAYRELRHRFGSVRFVDAARSPSEVAEQARELVIEHLEDVARANLEFVTGHRASVPNDITHPDVAAT